MTLQPPASTARDLTVAEWGCPLTVLRAALADLVVVAESEGYAIDMSAWWEVAEDFSMCHVCLAGAVLARRCPPQCLDVSSLCELVTGNSEVSGNVKVLALEQLDVLRRGDLDRYVRPSDIVAVRAGNLNNVVRRVWPVFAEHHATYVDGCPESIVEIATPGCFKPYHWSSSQFVSWLRDCEQSLVEYYGKYGIPVPPPIDG